MDEQPNTEIKRGPGRPKLHPEPLRPSLRERLRGKVRLDNNTTDKFFIPDNLKPEGISLEWKRHSVYGAEDPYYIASMKRQGWEPVHAEDIPELVPEGMTGPILKEGLGLFARPQKLTDDANAERNAAARRQVKDREAANRGTLAPGTTVQDVNTRHGKGGLTEEVMRPIPVEE